MKPLSGKGKGEGYYYAKLFFKKHFFITNAGSNYLHYLSRFIMDNWPNHLPLPSQWKSPKWPGRKTSRIKAHCAVFYEARIFSPLFQPRPSAAAYDASASSSSSLAASNYALRDRVARTLGPIVKYQNGNRVVPDVKNGLSKTNFRVRHTLYRSGQRDILRLQKNGSSQILLIAPM